MVHSHYAIGQGVIDLMGCHLIFTPKCRWKITFDGEALKDVKSFTCLGSIIDEHGGSDVDVKAEIGKTRAAYLQVKNSWNSKQLSTDTKV
ncbi:unnamed protein product [Schistosoma margrebowiei]|uniref:Uncharacterized protein n=1 Tax=Schistosoma margrebowiei TaxID=48269 RepID=A0A183MN03_9TREM|nr:unnamed protein product [Schistosoma margrebowiei]